MWKSYSIYIYLMDDPNVGNYSSPMDGLGVDKSTPDVSSNWERYAQKAGLRTVVVHEIVLAAPDFKYLRKRDMTPLYNVSIF